MAELETNQIIPWLRHVFQLLSLVTRFGLLQTSGALIVTIFFSKGFGLSWAEEVEGPWN